jgi:hypothetical protein
MRDNSISQELHIVKLSAPNFFGLAKKQTRALLNLNLYKGREDLQDLSFLRNLMVSQ